MARVFLTGGTGYVGAGVLDALVRAGHHVDALVRNNEGAASVRARGGHPLLGDLLQPAMWRDAAAAADGSVHAAADSGARNRQIDAAAIDGLTSLPAREGRFLVYTSGCWVLGPTADPADEEAPVNPLEIVAWRPEHEQRVLGSASTGVRAIVVRPGVVYGGGRGMVGDLLKDVTNGLVRIVGTGENHWPLVYDRDLGELYARLIANGGASGIYHASDHGDETVNEIVAAFGEHAPIAPSVRHVPIAEARKKMGPYADALAVDQILRCPRARALGWSPTLHSVAGNAARLFEEWKRECRPGL